MPSLDQEVQVITRHEGEDLVQAQVQGLLEDHLVALLLEVQATTHLAEVVPAQAQVRRHTDQDHLLVHLILVLHLRAQVIIQDQDQDLVLLQRHRLHEGQVTIQHQEHRVQQLPQLHEAQAIIHQLLVIILETQFHITAFMLEELMHIDHTQL